MKHSGQGSETNFLVCVKRLHCFDNFESFGGSAAEHLNITAHHMVNA